MLGLQAQEKVDSARREAKALADSTVAANEEAERRMAVLVAQQAETAQLQTSLDAQKSAQQQREVCPGLRLIELTLTSCLYVHLSFSKLWKLLPLVTLQAKLGNLPRSNALQS